MNPEISELFDEIAELEERRWDIHEPCERRFYFRLRHKIESSKPKIQEISATLNPQIPEPYASMSRDEILGGIGQYEIS